MKIFHGKDKGQSDNRQSIADRLVSQREELKWGLWKIYLYWAWRFVLFVLFLVLAVNIEIGTEGVGVSLDHISGLEWAIVLGLGLLGPGIFVGWSYIWMWLTD